MGDLNLKVEKALDEIRPYLETDGGNVEVVEITDDFILKIRMTGNCSSCSMKTMTLKAGIEETIKRQVPEIKSIISLD